MSIALRSLDEQAMAKLENIHGQLSPENLTGDGEVPRSIWESKYQELQAGLERLRIELGLSPADVTEEAVLVESFRRYRVARSN